MRQLVKVVAIGLIFFGVSELSAQKQYGSKNKKYHKKRYELLLYGSGGISTLQYKVTTGKQSDGFGGQAGFLYHFFFNPKLSLKTGVEFSLYNASFALDNSSTRFMTTDIEQSAFEFRSTIYNYKENQYLVMLQIPIMLQLQVGAKHKFYAAAGGKVGIPISVKGNNSSTNVQNSGYYAEEDYEYTSQSFMGFGQFSGSNNNLKFKMAFMASAEIGTKWVMRDGYKFYTGICVDYGLNNIASTQNDQPPFIEYNSKHPSDFKVNSIIKSQYSQNGEMQPFTNKIVPLFAGVKLTLAF